MVGFVLSIFRGCSTLIIIFLLTTGLLSSAEGSFTVERIEGEVVIRRGVDEAWQPVRVGTVVRPEDTIRTGKHSLVVMRRDDGTVYRIPAETLVDGADFRWMDRDELLLRLALEDMLSVPERINGDRPIPRTTVLHGTARDRTDETEAVPTDPTVDYRINGARFLIESNYVASAILRIRETLRLYPEGEYRLGAMMLAAQSLESLELYEEAGRYYKTILDEGGPSSILKFAEQRLEWINQQVRK